MTLKASTAPQPASGRPLTAWRTKEATDTMPMLSVVVTLVTGKIQDLACCLESLHGQEDPPSLEIVIPYDDPCHDVTRLAEIYPDVRFIRAEGLDTASSRDDGISVHHNALRTIGLKAARGRYVALTEDHATVGPQWCRILVGLLEEHPELGAIGSAVECGSNRLLNRAVYACDFGRYQNPVPEGPAAFVSDANVVYRRAVLDEIRGVWDGSYDEYTVHRIMVEQGHPIWLTPRAAAWQNRGEMTLARAMKERYLWGRLFAQIRVEGITLGRRWIYACLSPSLPVVLTLRLLRRALCHPQSLGEFLAVVPHVALLNSAWACGEFAGYATGRSAQAPSAARHRPETTAAPAP
jgi:hypothetical protein